MMMSIDAAWLTDNYTDSSCLILLQILDRQLVYLVGACNHCFIFIAYLEKMMHKIS